MTGSSTGPLRLRRRAVLAAVLGAVGVSAARPVQADGTDGPAPRRYLCLEPDCSPYTYDPAAGDPTQGIPAGTAFEDLPDFWFCPDCGAPRSSFIPLG